MKLLRSAGGEGEGKDEKRESPYSDLSSLNLTQTIPQQSVLYTSVIHLVNFIDSSVEGISAPPANVPLMLYRYISQLRLPGSFSSQHSDPKRKMLVEVWEGPK